MASASRITSRAARQMAAGLRQVATPASKRTFVSAVNASARPMAARAVAPSMQVRGKKTVDFAGDKEGKQHQYQLQLTDSNIALVVYERSDWPREKLLEYFKDDTLAMIGYGSQGHGQGLNARDQGLNVIVGVRKGGQSWKEAEQDGWVEGKNLFPIDEAISRGTIIMNLLSDAAQSETWPHIKPQITKGKVSFAER